MEDGGRREEVKVVDACLGQKVAAVHAGTLWIDTAQLAFVVVDPFGCTLPATD